jgi:DNA-binding response OmpR family regulator
VQVVRDGIQALAAAAEFEPEAILLDLGLPGLDGLEVARRLRAEVGSPALILALTGYGDREHRQRTQGAGFDGHLVKPLDPDLLRAWLQNARSPTSKTPLGKPPP